jgi:hypothetical protein
MKLKLDQSGEIVEKWRQLGYEAETFPLLLFTPLLEVAWAEGFLQGGEKRKILEIYDEMEIAESEIYNELILQINERPTEEFFTAANEILAEWMNILPEEQGASLKKFLHLGCMKVACASSSISLKPDVHSICREERRQLEQIGNRFGFSLA